MPATDPYPLKTYLIFGSGRVGKNMRHYLRALGHQVTVLGRIDQGQRKDYAALFAQADIVAAAIPDKAIATWAEQWQPYLHQKTIIHFSGALTIDGLYGYHPLYSFPQTILSVETMHEIAFACPENGPDFSEIFPGAPNTSFIVPDKDRARYHALAVLSGNFVSYIWNETAREFGAYSDGAPAPLVTAYIKSIVDRFTENPTSSLTGPIARHDHNTVAANMDALENDPKLKALYKAFLTAAWPDYDDK